MEYRQLGRSGLMVSTVTLGTMGFGGTGWASPVGHLDVKAARQQIDICLEAGVNLIDTADIYSNGLSEEILGEALGADRDAVLLATKRSGVYPHTDDVIYAHEYGHMLGIPDEYSHSNEQLNALLHQAAPKTAASSRAALDKTTIERMALAALRDPLLAQLSAAIPLMTGALAAKRAAVTRKLAAAARAGVVTPDVRTELQTQLTAESEAQLGPAVPKVVAFQTTKNFSNLSIADDSVKGAFAVAALQKLVGDAYRAALMAPHKTNVAVADFDDVRINMSKAVFDSTAAGSPIAGAATTEATNVVGPAAGAPGLPPVPFRRPACWLSSPPCRPPGRRPAPCSRPRSRRRPSPPP